MSASMADLSAQVKLLATREKALICKLRVRGSLIKALNEERLSKDSVILSKDSVIKALNDELDVRKQLGRKRKTPKAEGPKDHDHRPPAGPFGGPNKRPRLSPYFTTIGQILWDTMIFFYYGDPLQMQVEPRRKAKVTEPEESVVQTLQPWPDKDGPSTFRQIMDLPDADIQAMIAGPIASAPEREADPIIDHKPEVLTFDIGDDSVEKSTMRRSSLEDTYDSMDWSIAKDQASGALDEADHLRSIELLAKMVEAKKTPTIDQLTSYTWFTYRAGGEPKDGREVVFDHPRDWPIHKCTDAQLIAYTDHRHRDDTLLNWRGPDQLVARLPDGSILTASSHERGIDWLEGGQVRHHWQKRPLCHDASLEYQEDFTIGEKDLVNGIFKLLDREPAPTLQFVEKEFSEMIAAMMLEVPKTSFKNWINDRIGGDVRVHEGGLRDGPILPWISWRDPDAHRPASCARQK